MTQSLPPQEVPELPPVPPDDERFRHVVPELRARGLDDLASSVEFMRRSWRMAIDNAAFWSQRYGESKEALTQAVADAQRYRWIRDRGQPFVELQMPDNGEGREYGTRWAQYGWALDACNRRRNATRSTAVIYAQISSGQKLHLAYEPGEGHREIVRAGFLSWPLCGRPMQGNYRMTCNLPLANACKNCQRIYRARSTA
jgi:hypothetical protein